MVIVKLLVILSTLTVDDPGVSAVKLEQQVRDQVAPSELDSYLELKLRDLDKTEVDD